MSAAVPPPAPPRALVVDDEDTMLRALSQLLGRAGYEVVAVSNEVEALGLARDGAFDVVLLDVMLPNLSGLDLLGALRAQRCDAEVVMMSASGSVRSAVAAVKSGAFDYLVKPFASIDEVTSTVARALERRRARQAGASAEERENLGMIGQSPAMRALRETVRKVAASHATVLIQGESGSGKELVARALHAAGPRAAEAFLSVNCSAVTESLLESELFGHEKGAFTGAHAGRRGLFEEADGGTLFLDEVGDVALPMQARLLRALQQGEVRRVGSSRPIMVDVRVIAATHVDLTGAIEAGRFREDLFYRLNVVNVRVPPLRERSGDIPLLAEHLLQQAVRRLGRAPCRLSTEALQALSAYSWPGNVRQLENAIERAAILVSGDVVGPDDLDPSVRAGDEESTVDTGVFTHLPYARAKQLWVRAFERRYLSALVQGNKTLAQAARAAGVDKSNFRRMLRAHGLAPRPSPGERD